MTLDLAVSRVVTKSLLLESALHSSAPWAIEVGNARFPAERALHSHGVSFKAFLTDIPRDIEIISLMEGDMTRAARSMSYPGEGGFWLNWDVSMEKIPV